MPLIKMQDDNCLISIAIDLSRIRPFDPFAEIAMRRILTIGRELDLLETLRRTEVDGRKIGKEIISLQAVGLGIDPTLAETQMLDNFESNRMVERLGDDVSLNYSTTEEVYQYGKIRFDQAITEEELLIIKLLCACAKKPMSKADLDSTVTFKDPFKEGIEKFLFNGNILVQFSYKGTDYIVSSRIYKDPDKFKEAMEVLQDHKFGGLLEFLEQNPGNPAIVIQEYLGIDSNTLNLLSKSGIIDPIRLNVKGDTKDYLYRTDLLTNRKDQDHFDLVRETLSNYRFGEYYSVKTKLKNLDRFLEYMLEHGYAGNAEAIGTDYRNLELKGILRIEKTGSGNNYRFWLLKRDVIEDARSILRGSVPIQSDFQVANISTIEGVVQSRSNIGIQLDSGSISRISDALRQIQEGSLT